MDLVRLKWTRGDWLRTSGVVGVLAVNWPVREGSVQERYTESAVGLSVALAALLLVAVTANFAGRKLLARLAFFFQGCVGIGNLLLPELGRTTYVQQGSVAACCLVTAVSMQLALETPATPLRALFLGAVLSFGVLFFTNTFFSRGSNSCQPR